MERIEDTDEAWEARILGNDPAFAERVDAETWAKEQQELDEALGLKAISIMAGKGFDRRVQNDRQAQQHGLSATNAPSTTPLR
jgi:hypothetical protein